MREEHLERVQGRMECGAEGPKFVPGKIMVINGVKTFIPGKTFPSSDGEVFVPGKVINGKSGPRFVPGQVIETEDGNEQFIPGQIMDQVFPLKVFFAIFLLQKYVTFLRTTLSLVYKGHDL